MIDGRLHVAGLHGAAVGTLLIGDDGRIVAAGDQVSVPEGADVIDEAGLEVFPCFIDAYTHLGIWEENVGRSFWHDNEASDPVTPHVRALDAINPRDPGLADALSAGVTTVCVTPGNANAICGLAAAIKTADEVVDRMVIRQPAGLKMALGENPKSVYKPRDKMPNTRMDTAELIREVLVETQTYLDRQARTAEDPEAGPPDDDLKKETRRWPCAGGYRLASTPTALMRS